jgi:hypothetical protein
VARYRYRTNMPTSAELRRIGRRMGIIVPRVARRLVKGKSPQPGWLPRRWLTARQVATRPRGGRRRASSAKSASSSWGEQWRREHGLAAAAPRPLRGQAPWVGASEVQAAADVAHLLIGERRRQVQVPGDGRLIVVWKSRNKGAGGVRPLIVAIGHNGSELSRIGPHDSVWTATPGRR